MGQACWGKCAGSREGQVAAGRGHDRRGWGSWPPAPSAGCVTLGAAGSAPEQLFIPLWAGALPFPIYGGGGETQGGGGDDSPGDMRVSMGPLVDHCPSLSPLFPWFQDPLVVASSPPTCTSSVALAAHLLSPAIDAAVPRLGPEPRPLTATSCPLRPRLHSRI